jgi:hypothetical protein
MSCARSNIQLSLSWSIFFHSVSITSTHLRTFCGGTPGKLSMDGTDEPLLDPDSPTKILRNFTRSMADGANLFLQPTKIFLFFRTAAIAPNNSGSSGDLQKT